MEAFRFLRHNRQKKRRTTFCKSRYLHEKARGPDILNTRRVGHDSWHNCQIWNASIWHEVRIWTLISFIWIREAGHGTR